jgi:hypothetical protein
MPKCKSGRRNAVRTGLRRRNDKLSCARAAPRRCRSSPVGIDHRTGRYAPALATGLDRVRPPKATWRSGYAAVCKTVYAGSIPAVASILCTCKKCSFVNPVRIFRLAFCTAFNSERLALANFRARALKFFEIDAVYEAPKAPRSGFQNRRCFVIGGIRTQSRPSIPR